MYVILLCELIYRERVGVQSMKFIQFVEFLSID